MIYFDYSNSVDLRDELNFYLRFLVFIFSYLVRLFIEYKILFKNLYIKIRRRKTLISFFYYALEIFIILLIAAIL